MSKHSITQFVRYLLAAVLLVGLVLSTTGPAAAAYGYFDIKGVKADESVTIHTHDFPANVTFTVRMDVAGNAGIDGIVVTQTNSGSGGTFDATYRIPAELRGKQTIAIRLESTSGYTYYNWFANKTQGTGVVPVTGTNGKPYLTFLGVKANETVTIEGHNLPASTTFTVRVGPFASFFRDYVFAPSVTSDSSGFVRFNISLPSVVEDVDMITVRLDGGGHYAFNAFKNVDAGSVTTIPVTGSSTCQIVSVTPGSALATRTDFDAVWTIKNTSTKTWDANSVDYKYVSGTKLHKYGDRFDLTKSVKPGETLTVRVDMLAPSSTGTYTTNWALVQSSTTLCSLPLTLRVK